MTVDPSRIITPPGSLVDITKAPQQVPQAYGGPAYCELGPILGTVTQHTARIMIETNHAVQGLNVYIRYSRPRGYIKSWNDRFRGYFTTPEEAMYEADEPPVQDHLVQVNTYAHRPTVFTVTNLRSNSIYSVHFDRNQLQHPDQDKPYSYCNIVTLPRESITRNLRTMVVSCNFLGPYKNKRWERYYLKNGLWKKLFNEQIKNKFYIDMLLHVGDQVYTDNELAVTNIFEKCLEHIKSRSVTELNQDDIEFIRDEMRRMYRVTWSFKYMRRVLANTSNFMIWDDHEIRDNFGSRECDHDQSTHEYLIGRIARETYWEYQRALREDIMDFDRLWNRHEGYFIATPPIGVLMLDSRTCRSFLRDVDADNIDGSPYYGRQQWADIYSWTTGNGPLNNPAIKVLFAVFTVPLAFISHKLTDKLAGAVEDLNDHLSHPKYKNEQLRALNLLCEWKNAVPGRQVLMISGDSHIGGYTKIMHNNQQFCYQLTTSPVSNPPASFAIKFGIRIMLRASSEIADDWKYKHHRWLGKRNSAIIDVQTRDSKHRELSQPIMTSYLQTRRRKHKQPR